LGFYNGEGVIGLDSRNCVVQTA